MKISKKVVAAGLGAVMSLQAPFYTAEAFDVKAALQGVLAYVVVGSELEQQDEEGQAEILEETKNKTGYLANQAVQDRLTKIVKRLEAGKHVKRSYAAYVNPETDYNAFMTLGAVMSVNKGAMDLLDDDELAYVIGHEMAHSEKRHGVNGAKKYLGLQTAMSAAVGTSGINPYIVGIAANFIDNEVFTMAQEKEADELGYLYYTDAGYNPGAAASAMAILRNTHGDYYREGLVKVIAPNNHPKTGDRVLKNGERLHAYSENHVEVSEDTVYLNGDMILKPEAVGRYTEEMRAYIMAGKIAKLYHGNAKHMPAVSVVGSTVYMDDVAIVTAPNAEEAQKIAERIRVAEPKPPVVISKKVKKHKKEDAKEKEAVVTESSIMKKTEDILNGKVDLTETTDKK